MTTLMKLRFLKLNLSYSNFVLFQVKISKSVNLTVSRSFFHKGVGKWLFNICIVHSLDILFNKC